MTTRSSRNAPKPRAAAAQEPSPAKLTKHGEVRGGEAAKAEGLTPEVQASQGAYGGKACDSCRGYQIDNGIENVTGVQNPVGS